MDQIPMAELERMIKVNSRRATRRTRTLSAPTALAEKIEIQRGLGRLWRLAPKCLYNNALSTG